MKQLLLTIAVMISCLCTYAQEEIVDVKTLKKESVEKKPLLGMESYKKNPQDTFTNEQFTQQTQEASEKNDVQVWKITLSLGFILIVLVGFLYLLKKFTSRFMGIQNGDVIRIASRLPVDSKNTLMMLRVYEEELLVGVGPNGINLISRFAPFDDEEGMIERQKEKENKNTDFETEFEQSVDIDSEEIV